MLTRIRVRWFRFTHGEDVFDGWPGEEPVAAPRRVVRRSQQATAQPTS
ncbi:MAG: hypothetical protein ACTHJL_07655 [Amnibacterium sp.]